MNRHSADVSHVAAVITVSDRSARGCRHDASGPIAVAALREAGFACPGAVVIPDGADVVADTISRAIDDGARLVVTTGGTGVAVRDQTPEGTTRVIEQNVPGIAEELRRIGATELPQGMLSRGLAGIARGALIVNLPGSPNAVTTGIRVVLSVAPHVIRQLDGAVHP